MKKPYPALCKDCKWSITDGNHHWNILCTNPVVNANDPWALTKDEIQTHGSSAREERSKRGLFTRCGIKGKLWEAK